MLLYDHEFFRIRVLVLIHLGFIKLLTYLPKSVMNIPPMRSVIFNALLETVKVVQLMSS